MIPQKFEYVVAKSLDDAVQLLASYGPDARIVSGGHSLIPLMKVRLLAPSALIDLGRVEELRFVREEGGEIVIGGLTTYRMLESSPLLLERAPLLAETASQIGDVQVRNRGTIGGNLTHADPASDLPAAVLALGARMKVVGPGGSREIPADSFFVDMLQSAVEKGEILSEVRVPLSRSGSGSSYRKARQSASGFALVGVAASLSLEMGKCADIRIGVTGLGLKPYRAVTVEEKLKGNALGDDLIREACSGIADQVEVLSDLHASAEYRRALGEVYARRAIETAAASVRT